MADIMGNLIQSNYNTILSGYNERAQAALADIESQYTGLRADNKTRSRAGEYSNNKENKIRIQLNNEEKAAQAEINKLKEDFLKKDFQTQIDNLNKIKERKAEHLLSIDQQEQQLSRKISEEKHNALVKQQEEYIDMLNDIKKAEEKNITDNTANIVKQQNEIYEQAIKNNRQLTDKEKQRLKELDIFERNEYKKTDAYKQDLDRKRDDAARSRQERKDNAVFNRQEQAKDSLSNMFSDLSGKFIKAIESGLKTLNNRFWEYQKNWDNIMTWNNREKGLSEMGNQYESRFTDIAGRMGTNKLATHNYIGSGLSTISGDPVLNKALNFNNELFPAISDAVSKGFQGDDAIQVAIENATDKKLMPWLNTQSDTWSTLQFNLNDDSLKQIKGQQLLLQATKEGNRLLQSGIIDSFTTDLLPVLTNIDFNTADPSKTLNAQGQALMASMIGEGYTEKEAYSYVQDIMKVWKDPTAGFEKGDYSSVMRANAAFNNGDIMDIAMSDLLGIDLAGSSGMNAGFITRALNLSSPDGMNRSEAFSRLSRSINGADVDSFSPKEGESQAAYEKRIKGMLELVTATVAHDTSLQNKEALRNYDKNQDVHGVDRAIENLKIEKEILQFLKFDLWKMLINQALTIGSMLLLSKIGGGSLGNVGGNLTSGIGGKILTGGAGLLAKGATYLPGVTAGSGGIAATGSLGATLSSIGGGSAVAGGAAVLAPLAVGAGGAYYGISQGIDDYKTGHNVRGTANVAGGVAMGVGGAAVAGGMLAAGAANVWNPVGWGLLIAGAVTLIGTTIHKAVTPVSGMADTMSNEIDRLKDNFKAEETARHNNLESLKKSVENAEDEESARRILVNSGLVPMQETTGKTVVELRNMITALQINNAKLSGEGEAALDASEEILRGIAETDDETLRHQINSNVLGMMTDYGFGKGNMLTKKDNAGDFATVYTGFTRLAESIQDEGARAEALEMVNTIFKDGELQDEELDVLTDMGGNWKSFWHTSIDRKRTAFRSARDIDGSQSAMSLFGVDAYVNTDAMRSYIEQLSNNYNGWIGATESDKVTYRDAFIESLDGLKSSFPNEFSQIKDAWKNPMSKMNITGYAKGTPFIPYDQLAFLHAGEAVLTKSQNQERMSDLSSTTGFDFIRVGLMDIVTAIRQQTTDLITYFSSANFNNRTGFDSLNMYPTMGETRIFGT